ncbi:MAG: hypothetical protein ABIL70_06300 [candidate division WOR-3 bacterium]
MKIRGWELRDLIERCGVKGLSGYKNKEPGTKVNMSMCYTFMQNIVLNYKRFGKGIINHFILYWILNVIAGTVFATNYK